MYHTYIDNRFTKLQVEKMRSADGSSETFHDFISDDELEFLRKTIANKEYPESGKTSKYAGASYKDPEGQVLKEIFDDKITKIIGDYDLDFFAWQEAINPWKIHADIRWYSDRIPYKVVLIPLDVISEDDAWRDTHTVVFKQRNYLEGNTNSNAGAQGNTDQRDWGRPCDQPGVQNKVDGFHISEEQHEKYFSHMPYKHLEGLQIDNIYKWTPGSCVIWDQNQLHCADNFQKNGITTKLSIIFFTNQKQ
jgi:hypothetical protein